MLGEQLFVTTICTAGVKPESEAAAILERLAPHLNMQTGDMKGQSWFYPALDGCGGLGYTRSQPICESVEGVIVPGCLWADTWTEKSLDHSFWIIASCRPYSVQALVQWFIKNVGPVLDFSTSNVGSKRKTNET